MFILNDVNLDLMKSIHDGSFPLPDLTNRLYILKKSAVENGKLVAVGLVRLTAEGILMTDQSLPLVTRANCSTVLIESLKSDAKSYGLDECHVFVKNEKVSKFLKHIGFSPCNGGQPLVIHF